MKTKNGILSNKYISLHIIVWQKLVRAGDKELYKKHKRKIEHRKLHTINLPVGTLMNGVSHH